MATTSSPLPLAPDIEALLAGLRWRIRAYIWLEALALIACVFGLAFWLSLAVDFWQEPPTSVRIAALVVAIALLLAVIFRYLLRRAFVPLTNRNMAVLLERRFADFGDSLLTAVELGGANRQDSGFNPDMLHRAAVQAVHLTHNVDLQKVFNAAPLVRSISLGALLLLSVIGFAFSAPAEFDIWKRRNLLLSDELWPRKTRLEIEGFAEGRAKIAKGTDLAIVVKADTKKQVPNRVEVRYRTPGGARGRENMVRDGVADAARDPYQNFSHTFQGVLAPIAFEVLGGDDRLRGLHIDVVDSPTVTKMTLFCEYPKYMVRPEQDLYTPRELAVTEFMQLPSGSRITVQARCNKPLLQAQVEYTTGKEGTEKETIQPLGSGDLASDFHFTLPAFLEDQVLLFTLLDADGISNRDPIRLSLNARPDEAPQLTIRLRGIGTAVTPAARLPIVGEISDDYGLASAWFDYALDAGEPAQRPLGKQPQGRSTLSFEDKADQLEAFDVRDELQAQPKQKLLITVKASDQYDLENEPHVGSSQKFLLDVVTPDQLRLLLEARELNLRRRFEQIIEEVAQTRQTLTDIVFAEKEKAAEPAPGESGGSLSSLFAQRGLQNARKNSHETLGVATAFDDIREELANNRLDTEELKARLKDRIADPLRQIADLRFPEFEQRLETLISQIGDAEKGPLSLARSIEQVDVILVEMQQVLSQMLELETFNEAVALLRSIIEEQQKINEKTKQERKKLLEN